MQHKNKNQVKCRVREAIIPFSTGRTIASFVGVVDVASSGGSKTRREWRGHCEKNKRCVLMAKKRKLSNADKLV